MGEKVLEIVLYLIRHIEENDGRFDGMEEMAHQLRRQGFTDNEINSAYLWVLDQYKQPELISSANTAESIARGYRRVLTDYERGFFSTEALGTLVELRQMSIINDIQLELIIEKAIAGGPHTVDAATVRTLAWSLIINDKSMDDFILGSGLLGNDEDLRIN